MIRFAEYVSLGHPDKIADYISQYLLDRYIEQDPKTRYAVEVQIKDHRVTLGGEVSSKCNFTNEQIQDFVRQAVTEIGYTEEYQQKWGEQNTICGKYLQVDSLIFQQSQDIAQGLSDNAGWGDQGIFFGYASPKKEDGWNFIEEIIVAIPLLKQEDKGEVHRIIHETFGALGGTKITINGTGRYVQHSSVADCGTTGRKLVVDFYGGASRIGGGSPWTKDGTKADLSLNLLARELSKKYAEEYKCEVFTSLACCIGTPRIYYSISDGVDNIFAEGYAYISPKQLIERYKLNTPIFASACKWGLFGEFQKDKSWEQDHEREKGFKEIKSFFPHSGDNFLDLL